VGAESGSVLVLVEHSPEPVFPTDAQVIQSGSLDDWTGQQSQRGSAAERAVGAVLVVEMPELA
jgi:hypothetical protein